MSNTADAWLLRTADNLQFSIGVHEAAEYIEAPVLLHVPLAPEYCKNIIFWHDMMVPVIDINLLHGNSATKDYQHVMVIAYQHKDHTPLAHVAFILASVPAKILVNDDDACELPESYPETLRPYVLSLFNYNDQVTSILDIARLSTDDLYEYQQ